MSVIIKGGSSSDLAGVDSNTNLKVNLPTTATQAGNVQNAFVRDSSNAFRNRITQQGEVLNAISRTCFSSNFNGAAAGIILNSQFNQQATTMTTAINAGFCRFNNGAITTLNTGVSLYSWRTFSLDKSGAIQIKGHIRHTQGAVANKVFEFGLGYYDVAANQAAAVNEFLGFRWTTGGGLVGALDYTTGGASTSLNVNINSGVPLSDSVSREYEILITHNQIEFWIDNVYQASINIPADGCGISKSGALPLLMRLYQTAAPASAPIFDVTHIVVNNIGSDADLPVAHRQALMGRHSVYNQQGLIATNGSTALIPASGTAPTAATGSNTATTFTGLGGFYRVNGAAVTATAHSNIIISSYTNPAIPETAGAASDAKVLVITDIIISPMVVTTVLAGGGFTANWFVTTGSTALSLATTDAIGGAAVGTKAPKFFPLGIYDTLAAAAAVGTVSTRVGNSSVSLQTPIVVNPGEVITVGIRCPYVAAAVTSGTIDGSITLIGYWL